MAKRSEVEARIAALQAELENADTDDEVWIKDGDHQVQITGKRATTILSRYAKLWEDENGDGEDEEEVAEDEKPKRESLFKAKGK